MSKMSCGGCLKLLPEDYYYCCCEQIFLCELCCEDHKSDGHYLLDKNIDISRPCNYSPNILSEILNHLESLKSKIKEKCEDTIENIKSGKYSLIDPNSPPIKITLKIDPDFLKMTRPTFSVDVFLVDENSKIKSVSFPDNKPNDINVEYNFNILNYYLLNWNNKHIIVDGIENRKKNLKVCIVSPENGSESILTELPENLISYYPLINENILYILGGRILEGFSKQETDEILCYDLIDAKRLKSLRMKSPRFNIAACIHNERLYIVSYRNDNLEILDLATKNSIEIKLNVEITECSVLVSNSKQLFLLTRTGIYLLNENNKVVELTEFKGEDKVKINEEEWNMVRPLVLDDEIIFFGSKNAIYFSSKKNSFHVEEINF